MRWRWRGGEGFGGLLPGCVHPNSGPHPSHKEVSPVSLEGIMGMTMYARRMNLYISRFSDGVLFSYSTIKKMATDGARRWIILRRVSGNS
jgi:hypothetical protein